MESSFKGYRAERRTDERASKRPKSSTTELSLIHIFVCLGCIVHVHFSGDSLGMIALIISSHMIMLLLVEVVK